MKRWIIEVLPTDWFPTNTILNFYVYDIMIKTIKFKYIYMILKN